jgi:hypothetical protein
VCWARGGLSLFEERKRIKLFWIEVEGHWIVGLNPTLKVRPFKKKAIVITKLL